MTEKFKKIDRQYVLSDSTVNEYGFRLLTSGYQIDTFRKNPIGYYMHKREEGIVLKWEDLKIEDDQVLGTPVINLSNQRGMQTCAESENGFLNAASVGHIVVLEYSMEKELMLPGQTGPTITKWYNKECSLVDIPGNSNALTQLYDADENVLNLADMSPVRTLQSGFSNNGLLQLCRTLEMSDQSKEGVLLNAVVNLVAEAKHLKAAQLALETEKLALVNELAEINTQRQHAEINALLERALEDKKITTALRAKLAADYAHNASGLKDLLSVMPAYRTIAEQLKGPRPETLQWDWDDYEKNDPTGNRLKELRANDPTRYRELFDRKFAA